MSLMQHGVVILFSRTIRLARFDWCWCLAIQCTVVVGLAHSRVQAGSISLLNAAAEGWDAAGDCRVLGASSSLLQVTLPRPMGIVFEEDAARRRVVVCAFVDGSHAAQMAKVLSLFSALAFRG